MYKQKKKEVFSLWRELLGFTLLRPEPILIQELPRLLPGSLALVQLFLLRVFAHGSPWPRLYFPPVSLDKLLFILQVSATSKRNSLASPIMTSPPVSQSLCTAYFLSSTYFVLSRVSRVQLFVTPWTVAHQAPRSMGFSRQEYWSRLPFPPSGDLPDLGTEPESLTNPALAGSSFTKSATWEAHLF